MTAPKKPTPRQEVEIAKARLISPAHQRDRDPSPAAKLVREHPAVALGVAAAAGFTIVALRPGRLIIRQVLLAGTGILLRRALVKYVKNH